MRSIKEILDELETVCADKDKRQLEIYKQLEFFREKWVSEKWASEPVMNWRDFAYGAGFGSLITILLFMLTHWRP